MALSSAASFDDIETARLLLRLAPLEAVEAGLAGDLAGCQARLSARVPVDLLEEPAVLVNAKARLAEDARYQPWSVRTLLRKDSTGFTCAI